MSDKPVNIFDAYIVNGRKSMTASQFAQLAKSDRDEIKSVRFVTPTVGSNGFGHFDVELNSKAYEVAFD